MFSLTHQFIVKPYIYFQGYMFQLYRAIFRPLLKNRSISNFICIVRIPTVQIKFDRMDLFFSRSLKMAL